MIELLCLCSLH